MRPAASLLLLLCPLALFAAGSAHADGPVFLGAVTRSADEQDQAVADKIADAFAEAFADRDIDVVRPREDQADQGPPEGALEDLDKLLGTARTRFFAGEFDKAVASADDGIARFESTYAYRESTKAWNAYAELMLVRTLALRRLSKKDPADRAMLALAAQMPDYVPDPSLVPPKVTDRYATIKKNLEDRKKRPALRVTSVPAGATVVVDGVVRGETPLELTDLLPGPHYVAVIGDGRQEEYVVLKKRDREVRAELDDPRRHAAQSARQLLRNGTSHHDFATEAARVSGVCLIAVVERDRDGFSVVMGRIGPDNRIGLTALAVAADLSDLDGAVQIMSDIATSENAQLIEDDDTLLARFLGIGPQFGGGGGGTEPEDDGSLLVPTLIGSALGAVVLGVVAAAGATGAYFFFTRPANPGGTDLVIDASRL